LTPFTEAYPLTDTFPSYFQHHLLIASTVVSLYWTIHVNFMSGELELGKLHLTVAKSDFQLFSTTSVLFTPSEGHNELLRVPISPKLDLSAINHAWVRRGHGLRLEVTVLVDGKPPEASDFRRLSDILNKAEVSTPKCPSTLTHSLAQMWPQLGLKVTQVALQEDQTTSVSSNTIVVGLTHDKSTSEPQKESVHRLCYTVPAADVAPPAMVEIFGLNLVRLELQITKKTRTRRPKRRREAYQLDDGNADAEAALLHADTIFEPLLLAGDQEDGLLQWPQPDSGYSSLFSTQSSNNDDETLLLGTQSIEDDEGDMLDLPASLPTCNAHSQTHSIEHPCAERQSIVPKNNVPKKRSTEVEDAHEQPKPEAIQFHCITSLVDAALRLSIHEKPLRLRRGIKVKGEVLPQTLSDISPALWSPGYLQAFILNL
jgi:hypothetical protein